MDHDSEIVVWNVDGSGAELLTDNFDDDRYPAWSPDGARIAFVSDRAGIYDIYTANADGSDPVQVTDDNFRESRLAWSPDGTRIAYVRFSHDGYYRPDDHTYGDEFFDYSDEDFDIFVVGADGSNPVRVTHDDYRELAPVWSPDGTRIAYTRDVEPDTRNVRLQIIVVGADGSEPFKLADDGIDPVWSPDGTGIAYDGNRGRIHVAEADGSSTRQLVQGENPSWSPDSTRIAYSSDRYPATAGRTEAGTSDDILLLAGSGAGLLDDIEPPAWEIHIIEADGTNPVQLTDDRYDKFDPQWSPDGTRILYTYGDAIYVMNADGTGSRLVAEDGRDVSWSPDGLHLIYTRPPVHYVFDLFVVEADGTDMRKLADRATGPVWSPDDTRIAYSRDGEITVANADGTRARELTDTSSRPRGVVNSWPSWSPDGTRISYNHGGTGFEVYVMDADGTSQMPVTPNVGEQGPTPWSPDGRRIAYSVPGPLDSHTVLVDADGANPVPLTGDNSTFHERRNLCPEWSPDGLRIAFRSEAVLTFNDYKLYVIDVAGTNATQLAESDDFTGCPRWSPDGTRLAYHVNRGDNYRIWEIYTMDPDGRDVVRLTDSGAGPVWSPDGTRIAFVSDRDGDWEIFVMDFDGSNQTQLTFNNDNDWGPTWYPLGG